MLCEKLHSIQVFCIRSRGTLEHLNKEIAQPTFMPQKLLSYHGPYPTPLYTSEQACYPCVDSTTEVNDRVLHRSLIKYFKNQSQPLLPYSRCSSSHQLHTKPPASFPFASPSLASGDHMSLLVLVLALQHQSYCYLVS